MVHGAWCMVHDPDFPIALLERGFHVSIADAEASVEVDRWCILNSIVGRPRSELDKVEPLAEHGMYDQVNRTLCNLFADSALAAAFKAQRDMTLTLTLTLTLIGWRSKAQRDMTATCEVYALH